MQRYKVFVNTQNFGVTQKFIVVSKCWWPPKYNIRVLSEYHTNTQCNNMYKKCNRKVLWFVFLVWKKSRKSIWRGYGRMWLWVGMCGFVLVGCFGGNAEETVFVIVELDDFFSPWLWTGGWRFNMPWIHWIHGILIWGCRKAPILTCVGDARNGILLPFTYYSWMGMCVWMEPIAISLQYLSIYFLDSGEIRIGVGYLQCLSTIPW